MARQKKHATYRKRQDNELENRLKREIQALENNSTNSPTSLKALDSKKSGVRNGQTKSYNRKCNKSKGTMD